ncbi:MAG: (2Fe-2S)-binding protein [Pseudomonadota bacterium]
MPSAADALNRDTRKGMVRFTVDGAAMDAFEGQSVASALLHAGIFALRASPNKSTPRGALCMMGACQECTILIDARPQRACQTAVEEGMQVVRGGVHKEAAAG